jgi:hypothetical protein
MRIPARRADHHVLRFLPPVRTLGDKLHELARLAPEDVAALEVLVDAALKRRRREAKQKH